MKRSYWLGKRVFIIGQTSFIGVWLSFLLRQMGAKVSGFGTLPESRPNLFSMSRIDSMITSVIGDVRSWDSLLNTMASRSPDAVIYLEGAWEESAQTNIRDYVGFNGIGVMNALEAVVKTMQTPRFLFARTEIAEDKPAPLFSVSYEIVMRLLETYRQRHPGQYQTLTYTLAVGGGDWGVASPLGSLITEAQQTSVPKNILESSWLHALDVCAGILDTLEHQDLSSRQLQSSYSSTYDMSWVFQRLREERAMSSHDSQRIWQRHQETLHHAKGQKATQKKLTPLELASQSWKPFMEPEQGIHLTAAFYADLAQGKQSLDIIRAQCISYIQDYGLSQIDNGELDLVSLAASSSSG